MTRKRSARRDGRRAPDLIPDFDSTHAEASLDSLDALATDYFGSAARPRERGGRGDARGGRGDARGAARAIGPLRREIERTLIGGLAGARDPRLRDLMIIGVDPAPDASCFQVTVAAPAPLDPDAHAALMASLRAARGTLRAELARSLQRKRTPELRFAIGTVADAESERGEPSPRRSRPGSRHRSAATWRRRCAGSPTRTTSRISR
jgi:ribosome-binding factor A